jgi:eukaryotic-like serine/threonine-protein kinase
MVAELMVLLEDRARILGVGRCRPPCRRSGSTDPPVIVSRVAKHGGAMGPERPGDGTPTRVEAPAETVIVSETMPARLVDPTLITAVPVAERAGAESSGNDPRYVILGEVARGGMGVVHVARDLELLRRVALKRLSFDASAGSARQRFLREVQITAQLDHPHVVPVYSLENAAGAPAYAMKLVEGQTFAEFLEEAIRSHERGEGPDDAHALPTRLEHFLKVCDALAYAHDKGVIHRDLKPANLMLGRHHEVYVMDWGICRVLSGATLEDETEPCGGNPALPDRADATALGTIMGTPSYMSPEQARGRSRDLDPRSDQCALGLVLYEIVTLRRPFEGTTPLEILERAAQGWRRPVTHAYGERIAPELVAIVEKATAADRADRYADVRAMADDLRRFLRGEEVHARPDGLWQRASRGIARRRHQVLVALLAVFAVATLSVLGVFYVQEQRLWEADLRERRVDALVASVSRRASGLQVRFLRIQDELESLAAVAGHLLEFGAPVDRAVYWLSDFRDPSRRPSDLARRETYEEPVSFEHAVWIPAPGIRPQDVDESVQRLLGLRALRNEIFTHTHARRLLLSLESGVTLQLPGTASVAEDYDGRSETWYRAAAEQTVPSWGSPFAAAGQGTLSIPVSHAIRDHTGARLGVVAFELPVDAIVRILAEKQAALGALEVLLLNGEDRVLASTRASRPRSKPLADDSLRRAIGELEIGATPITVDGEAALAIFDRLHPLGWVLVALVADEGGREAWAETALSRPAGPRRISGLM